MGKIADALRAATLPQQLRAQMLTLDTEFEKLKAENDVLKAENQRLQAEINPFKREVQRLKDEIHKSALGNPEGMVCIHCGSPRLKRIGSRPDPTFGVLGVMQPAFSCLACGKESAFTPKP